MKRCPQCHRFGVDYDPYSGIERCVWRDCLWVNKDGIDVDKVKHPIRFHKFIAAIKEKAIVGSREFCDWKFVEQTLCKITGDWTLVSGGARGVDKFADILCLIFIILNLAILFFSSKS
jgi:hypothetical protein